MKKLLAIECSTDIADVAISDGNECLSIQKSGNTEHAKNILNMVEKLLADAQWSLSEVQGIVFGKGPGSFTGLRVACAFAQGLAVGRDLPIYPVSTLDSIAHTVFEKGAAPQLVTLLDARMNQLYWAFYSQNQLVGDESVSNPETIAVEAEEIVVAGRGFDAYNGQFTDDFKSRVTTWHDCGPSAAAMIQLVQRGQVKAVDISMAQPSYIRNNVTHGAKNG